ncbi:MAG: MlaD family protein, partial [Gemmatimonadaceae bacterium]
MVARVRWTELSYGLMALAAVIGAAILILVFGRVGQLHGKKFTLYVTASAARGLIRGSEVWLDGQRVGTVSNVAFQPPSVGTAERLVIALRMLDDSRPHIRRNSTVQIRSGTSIIGDQVVYVSSGTTDQPAVAEGDTLHAVEQKDLEGMTSDAALAAKQLPGIIENVKLLDAQLTSAQGTLGALGAGGGELSIGPVRARAERLVNGITHSTGT